MGNVYAIADTHLKHAKMRTYCDRPEGFTELVHHNVMTTVKSDDMLIHFGDVGIGPAEDWVWMVREWPGYKTLVRGNHDDQRSPTWWLAHGFHSVCDGMIFRGVWVTHKPAIALPEGCNLNFHGHLHNIWHGFHANAGEFSEENRTAREGRLFHPWQRLLALEYTGYRPVEWNKFLAHPEKYQATGPSKKS